VLKTESTKLLSLSINVMFSLRKYCIILHEVLIKTFLFVPIHRSENIPKIELHRQLKLKSIFARSNITLKHYATVCFEFEEDEKFDLLTMSREKHRRSTFVFGLKTWKSIKTSELSRECLFSLLPFSFSAIISLSCSINQVEGDKATRN
jgi:hypothetical protein